MHGEAPKPPVKACEPFAVMAKPVGARCNMACGYCYYLESEGVPEGAQQTVMSDALLEAYIRQYIQASPGPVVPFCWHGGEPTLAGLGFFKRAVAIQQRTLPKGWRCWNNIQTNGILLDDAWCAFLADNEFDVGLSIDGAQHLHDAVRKDSGGRGTYALAAAAIRRLQAHGVQPDLLCTVTAATAQEPLAAYRALREFNTGWIQFIPVVRRAADGGATPDSVTGEGYGHFLCTVFDEWLRRDIGRLDVQLFAELSLIWAGGTTNLCQMSPTCGRVLVVEHDGSVFACDHFVARAHCIGNIRTEHLGALVDAPAQRRFGNAKRESLPSKCRACRWLSVCNGGCPKDRFARTEAGEGGLNHLCAGFERFFAHAEKPLKQVIRAKERGLAPEAIMAAFNDEALARWRGVGRNDPCPCGSGRKAKSCCWAARL
jgi:uncharacterized protein